jgi:hypothetical protein
MPSTAPPAPHVPSPDPFLPQKAPENAKNRQKTPGIGENHQNCRKMRVFPEKTGKSANP